MSAVILVSQTIAEELADVVKNGTVTARVTTSANAVLWEGTANIVDSSETDGSFTISTDVAAATATGTPAKVKFYNGSNAYRWQTTIGTGGSTGFSFAGDIIQGNNYQFTSSPLTFPITAEN